jgi:hypothetical protein
VDTIKKAPEYDERHPLEIDYEKALHDYYHKVLTK